MSVACRLDPQQLTICFAHFAYRLGEMFAARRPGMSWFEVRTAAELEPRIGEAEVLVISGLWHDELLKRAGKLRFIQSISAGTDQFSKETLRAHGVRLASAQGANERAVAEHAMALLLALVRKLPDARDHQRRREWRGMISDPLLREDELGGKTLLIVGLGRIGTRLARLARAFDMRVLAVRRRPSTAADVADRVLVQDQLHEVLPEADFVALTCPLNAETAGMVGAGAFAAMRPSAYLINVARGRVVDEPALISALERGRIAGAALDCFRDEPLPPQSPLWGFSNVLITPHTAGETRRYEDNVLDLLLDNLDRLSHGESQLRNQIV
jgi:phosphoglycerate dehydrogenase-like enzyme